MAIALNAVQMPFVLSSQWNTPLIPPMTRTKMYLKVFLKGQPKALGTLQILVAFIQIPLGVILYFVSFFSYTNFTIDSGIPFWGPFLYIISGSLAVGAANHKSSCLIRGCLAMNIVSSLASALELGLLIPDISDFTGYCNNTAETPCTDHEAITWSVKMIVLISLILASLLEFCVAISVSSFGCRALSYTFVDSYPQQALLIPSECWAGPVQPAYAHTLNVSPAPVAAHSLYPALYENQKRTNTIPNPVIETHVIFP